ncbi:MAG: endo alpha-1,4 polygalactosaminidase [Treponema sp.]|nr:endo alpha-1,4 polygalactosaminidase [Treponema sp.]
MKKLLYIMIITGLLLAGCGDEGDDMEDEYAARMQRFVIQISDYARGIKPGFIVIPQNGCELAFNSTDPGEGVMEAYINAIDGIGNEELFYDGSLSVDGERLSMLRTLKSLVKIMVSDFVSNNANIADAAQRARDEGFISFPRSAENYHYGLIPSGGITDENSGDITVLSDAKNYLYLISTDNFPTKQAMIQAVANTNYDVVLIDMFFEGAAFTAAETGSLKTKANGGERLAIAYINIGAAENWRYYWKPEWKRGSPSWLKKKYSGYDDEIWVEYWNDEWQEIICGNGDSYIKRIIDAGFDGVYLDNVEAYYFLIHN